MLTVVMCFILRYITWRNSHSSGFVLGGGVVTKANVAAWVSVQYVGIHVTLGLTLFPELHYSLPNGCVWHLRCWFHGFSGTFFLLLLYL